MCENPVHVSGPRHLLAAAVDSTDIEHFQHEQ